MPNPERGSAPEAARETPRDVALKYVARQEKQFAKLPDGDIKYEQVGRLSKLRAAIESGDREAIDWTEHDALLEHRWLKANLEDNQARLDEAIKERGALEKAVEKQSRYLQKLKEQLRQPKKQLTYPGPPPDNLEYGGADWQDYQVDLAEYNQALYEDQDDLERERADMEMADMKLSDIEDEIRQLREDIARAEKDLAD